MRISSTHKKFEFSKYFTLVFVFLAIGAVTYKAAADNESGDSDYVYLNPGYWMNNPENDLRPVSERIRCERAAAISRALNSNRVYLNSGYWMNNPGNDPRPPQHRW
jgi:hypothetical protein